MVMREENDHRAQDHSQADGRLIDAVQLHPWPAGQMISTARRREFRDAFQSLVHQSVVIYRNEGGEEGKQPERQYQQPAEHTKREAVALIPIGNQWSV